MTDDSLSRRSVLGLLVATTGGCVGRVFDPPSVLLTGVRLHNWTQDRVSVRVELLQGGEQLLDEQVSLAPLRTAGSVASFAPGWTVEAARYRLRLELVGEDVTLERQLPPEGFAWDGCAYVDADVENGWSPVRTPAPDADKWFEMHLQEVVDPADFSSDHCPNS